MLTFSLSWCFLSALSAAFTASLSAAAHMSTYLSRSDESNQIGKHIVHKYTVASSPTEF
jgi:hypothetical protein